MNEQIIGDVNGPSISTFAALWSNIATRYATNPRILFSLMNAPHFESTPPSPAHPQTFLHTIQSAVHAIRSATNTTAHTILLPSMDWSDPGTFHTDVGGGAALLGVTNPDGSTRGLVFDVQVFPGGEGEFGGVDGDGGEDEDRAEDGDPCPDEDSNPSTRLIAFTQFLRCNNRKALVSAIGGGSGSPRCLKFVCGVTDFIKANSDGESKFFSHSVLAIVYITIFNIHSLAPLPPL
jgi:endoglucanase